MNVYKVGQVWERDGRRREIVKIEHAGNFQYISVDSTDALPKNNAGCFISSWYVTWRRDTGGVERRIWCSTWLEWARKATLVRDTDETGGGA